MRFTVFGEAACKGNHKWNPVARKIYDTSKKLKPWEREVRRVASRRAGPIITGPVAVQMSLRLARPKTVKKPYPIAKNKDDLDKLVRGVGDPLTGTAYEDDSQAVIMLATKSYADPASVRLILQAELEFIRRRAEEIGAMLAAGDVGQTQPGVTVSVEEISTKQLTFDRG